jgi:ATP-dependent exoDNAse (exonuclease V) beta subunit
MKTGKPDFPNTVIRASAGTGKTFQLTNRFLGLVFAGAPLDSILATTFTRKAAGEILDRVLLRLAEAALDHEKLAKLAREIQQSSLDSAGVPLLGTSSVVGEGAPSESTACSRAPCAAWSWHTKSPGLGKSHLAPLDSASCRHMLGQMVRHMHRLRVGTLDSFFVEIARNFSLELGLPPGWQIVDEMVDRRLRAAAVRSVLEDQSTSDVLRLMHLLTKGQAARSVSEQISLLVEDLYSYYLEAPKEAWQSLPRHKQLAPPELAEALAALEAVSLPTGKRFADARRQALEDARNEAWEDFLAKGLAAKILAGEETYYRQPIAREVVDAYQPLLRHAKAVLVGRIASQTEATQELLERFDAAYQALKLSERALRFEDITRKLGAAEVADRLDDVLYRLDVHISHLLLDEFQDTSPLQWRVLRPLARRTVRAAAGQSFFCVGDVKQAIYGWRGGVAEIFEVLDEQLEGLQRESLDRSWRSSQAVIDCVNQIFQGLAANPVAQKYAAAAQKWAGRFAEHSTVRENLPGYCSLATAPQAEEGQEQRTLTLQFAADEIVRLHRQSPGYSVGVLVRRNAAVARLIYELRQRGIEASEEGGNPLSDSPAVELVLSLLALADHPGDTIARFHLANSPLARPLGIEDHQDTAAASRLSLAIRQSLLTAGYGPTVYEWTRQLAPSCDRRDLGRLLQLVELTYGYEARATARVDDFVALVRQQRVESPATADVRVMTVHQAKGLQFDIVVLPELDFGLAGQPPEIVVSRPEPTAAIQRICRYVPKALRPLLPAEFAEMFDAQERHVVEESLCVLYVALTRAVHALHMIVAPAKHNERTIPGTHAGLLRAALAEGQEAPPRSILYEHGDAGWFANVAGARRVPGDSDGTRRVPATLAEQERPLVVRLAESPAQSARGLDRRSPSQLEGGPRVDLASQLRLGDASRLERGTLLHAWFQEIEWLDDARPAEELLRRIAARPEFRRLDLEKLLAEFHAALEKPAVREVLSRSTYQIPPPGTDRRLVVGEAPASGYPGVRAIGVRAARAACAIHASGSEKQPRWQVWRERPFAIRDGDAILSGQIDRLVLLYDADQVVAADVVDYKTDALPADDPQAVEVRAEIYRPQLEAYRRAVSKLYRLAPERISARLLFVEPGVVWGLGAGSTAC